MNKLLSATMMLACFCCAGSLAAQDNRSNTNTDMEEKLNLTQDWDKVFPQSDKVNHTKITFHNRYGVTLESLWPRTCTSRRTRRANCRPSP